jgi:hypothetical protein
MIPQSAIAFALLATAGSALGCGFCVEDRVASVYDHAVVQRTAAQHHHVGFFALEAVGGAKIPRKAVLTVAESVPGIDKGTARASTDPTSLSVAFDPAKISMREIDRALAARFAVKGWTLSQLAEINAPQTTKLSTAR